MSSNPVILSKFGPYSVDSLVAKPGEKPLSANHSNSYGGPKKLSKSKSGDTGGVIVKVLNAKYSGTMFWKSR